MTRRQAILGGAARKNQVGKARRKITIVSANKPDPKIVLETIRAHLPQLLDEIVKRTRERTNRARKR